MCSVKVESAGLGNRPGFTSANIARITSSLHLDGPPMFACMEERRAIVAEDDAAIASLISAVLEDEGFSVSIAKHGAEALQLIMEGPPDLLITDLAMPVMTGVELIEELVRGGVGIPVVVISARQNLVSEVTGLPVVAVVRKPFDIDELVTVANAALATQRQGRNRHTPRRSDPAT